MKELRELMFNFAKNLFKKAQPNPIPEEIKQHPMSIITPAPPPKVNVNPVINIRKNVVLMVKCVYKSKKFPTDNLARYLLKNYMPDLNDEKLKPVYDELKKVQDFLRVLADVGNNNERIQRQLRDKVGDDLKAALAKLNEMVK